MRKIKWVSLSQLKQHEFRCTLRYIRNAGEPWAQIYLRLGEIQAETLKSVSKLGTPLLIGFLITSSLANAGLATVSLLGYTLSVPLSYIFATLAFYLHFFLLTINSAMCLIFIRSAESIKLKLPRFSASFFGLYKGQDELALVVPIVDNYFLKDKMKIISMLEVFNILIFLLLAVPLFAFIAYLMSWQANLAFVEPRNIVEGFTAFFSLGATILSTIYFVLFWIPLPFVKNKDGIRWAMLWRIHFPATHPRLQNWLSDSR